VDSAGLRNIVFALARFTSERSEKLKHQDPATAACWLRSARRAATAERIGTQLASRGLEVIRAEPNHDPRAEGEGTDL
jgi:hypothetical protein